MIDLPKDFIVLDTEFTAWEGSHANNWSKPDEQREIIQIGAVRVEHLQEVDSFLITVRPVIRPQLSKYIIDLTGVTQTLVDREGVLYETAQQQFHGWCSDLPVFSYGLDGDVLRENCELYGLQFPFKNTFYDIRDTFEAVGIDTTKYMSSTIPGAFGVQPPPDAHNALNDARSVLIALQSV